MAQNIRAATKTAAKAAARPRLTPARAAKRARILEAAAAVFEREGLEGASLRAIAAEAGYTPAALYFHFDSKEAVYGELLAASLDRLQARTAAAAEAEDEAESEARHPRAALRRAALAFFAFYAENPRDLDLGFYLFRGGMKPTGLGRELDLMLNAQLSAALAPITEAARALGASEAVARALTVDCFAQATGLLLLAHTGRIRLFGVAAEDRMAAFVDMQIAMIAGASRSRSDDAP